MKFPWHHHRVAALSFGAAVAGLALTGSVVEAAPPAPPTVTGVNPTNGPTTGGTTVSISGTSFKGVSQVDFGPANPATIVSTTPTNVVVTSPAGSGTVDVTVTTVRGTSATSAADHFTYNNPPATTVDSVTPSSGPTAGGTPVVFAGSNFDPTCAASFGGVAASTTTYVSSTEVDATTPGFFPPGAVPAELSCSSGSDAKTFTYSEATGSGWSLLSGSAKDVASGGESTFVLGTNAVAGGWGVWEQTGSTWSSFPGGLVDIAVGPDGNPWGINSAHEIWRYAGGSWNKLPGSAYDIAVGPDGTPFVLGTNAVAGGWGIWTWSGSSWNPFPGGGTRIAVGAGDNPWVVNSENQIWAYSGSWGQLSGSAVNIAANAYSVWVLGTNSVPGGNGLWYFTGSGWASIPGGGVNLAVPASTLPIVTNSSNQIWQRT